MKRFLNLLIGLVLLISCQAQKEKLELNLTKGEIYNQKMTSNVSILQTVNGQQVNMKMSINAKMTYKVTDIQNAVYDMEVRYESLIMKMSLPNGEMEFSSEKNDEKDIFSTILGTMKNKPFLVKMTKTGKVNEVKNIEAVFSNMFDKFPQLSDVQKQQIQGQIMQAYGEKAFKGNIEMCSAIFTDSNVSKGDKWTINTQLEAGMSAKMETVYELKEITDNYYQIFGNSKIETADKDAYIESNGMPLKYDMTGTMTSDIKIDKKTGWTINALINQSIKGTAYVKDNPQIPGGMTIPMTMNNEMTITEK
jgi:hypothetical protein